MDKKSKNIKKNKKTFSMNDDYHVEIPASPEYKISNVIAEKERLQVDDNSLSYEEAEVITASPLLGDQVDLVVQELSGFQVSNQVYLADVRQLEPYPNQPFQPYPLDRLQDLAEDIKRVGVLSPLLVRRKKNRLEILAGHNRCAAAKLAGLSHVPVIILDIDDDDAVLVLTSTNLRQREKLLPSEKAFAYKLQMEALKRQGKQSDDGNTYDASSFITNQTGDSRMQIHRYIRLTELIPAFLRLLDQGKISMTPAVHVSYLTSSDQEKILKYIVNDGISLTIEKAAKLKKLSATGENIDSDLLDDVMYGQKKNDFIKGGKYIKLSAKKLDEFLPDLVSDEEIENFVLDALEYYTKDVLQKRG